MKRILGYNFPARSQDHLVLHVLLLHSTDITGDNVAGKKSSPDTFGHDEKIRAGLLAHDPAAYLWP